MRAPEAPMGWPRATAPPFTFTFSGLSFSWRVTAIAATAKASFNSTRSTSSSRSQPVFASSFSTASTGAIITHFGSTPLTACATMRAIGCLPKRAAFFSLVTITAAAPSFVPGAFPAVTVPSFLNAGFSLARISSEVSSRGDSSILIMIGSPFFCGISTGTICALKIQDFIARIFIFFGDQFTGYAHVKIFVYVPQAVVDHGIDHFLIAEAEAAACAFQQIRAIGHGLHAASDDHFRFAQLHRLRREADGLQTGAANFVDGHCRDARIEAAAQRRLARGILAQARLHNVAQDRFVHLIRLDAGAAHYFGDDFRAEFRRRERREPAHEFSDGRAHGA